jgi:hypothetical protein
VEGFQPVAELPRTRRRTRAASVLAWVRERLTTTPGRLALMSILVVAGAVCFGVIASSAERSRAQAANAVRTTTEPLLVQAVTLYSALSDANATVTTGLLTGGLEPSVKRTRYLQDLGAASAALTTLTREAGTSASARDALGTVAGQLPVYTGLVEAARANTRQRFPIGAAYLRQASGLLTGTVLPAAGQLYAADARRLSDGYGSGAATSTLVAFIAASVISLGLLLFAQRYLTRVSRRILNMLMLAATAVLAAVSVWGLVGLLSEQNALATAQRDGSDSVEVLSATKILLSRAQGDQSLTLVNRGTDETDPRDFAAVMRVLGPNHATGGLIGEGSALARQTGTTRAANQLTSEFASYRMETTQIDNFENNGQISSAIGHAPASAATSGQMSANLDGQIRAAQGRFEHSAADATSALTGLWIAVPLLTVLAAALALLGLRQRINEYR